MSRHEGADEIYYITKRKDKPMDAFGEVRDSNTVEYTDSPAVEVTVVVREWAEQGIGSDRRQSSKDHQQCLHGKRQIPVTPPWNFLRKAAKNSPQI